MALKKFTFKLDPLLRVRKIEENRALAELAKVMLRVNAQESARTEAMRLFEEEIDRFEREQRDNPRFDLTTWQIYDRYLERLDNEAVEAAKKLEEIRPEMEAEMAKVMEARRQRRVVEIIKERARAEYDKEYRKAERRELEELNRRRNVGIFRDELTQDDTERRSTTAAPERGEFFDPDEYHGIDEPTTPGKDRDYVSEYFEKMGLDKPPGS